MNCTVEYRPGQFCDAPAVEWAPFPICSRHAMTLYRTIDARLAVAQKSPIFMTQLVLDLADEAPSRRSRMPGLKPEPEPVVYFLLVG